MESRPHDYNGLVRCWRRVARGAGWRLTAFAQTAGVPVYLLRTTTEPNPRTVYLSAGIHGDEPAGPAALVVWAEKNLARLRSQPLLIFPCLNPSGLVNNSRFDARGRDLNRTFQAARSPSPIRELKRLIADERFLLSLTLHEDYEARGLYVYEVMRFPPFWGERLLRKAQPIIALGDRARIDRRRARAGLVRRQYKPERFPEMPESIYLHRRHSFKTFTIETPSEFAFEQRVAAQVAMIEECIRLAQTTELRGKHWTQL